jgi:hypothetical protein
MSYIINYDISIIIDTLKNFNYQKNPDKESLSKIYQSKIDENFLNNLKIIDKYHSENETIIANLSKKNLKNKKNFRKNGFIRNIPLKRPVTFLNKPVGKDQEIKKEINGNLNKISNKNFSNIFENILSIFSKNYEIFNYQDFIDSVFDKATMQPTYCPLYVKLIILMKDKNLEMIKKLNRNLDDSKIDEMDTISKLVKEKCDEFKNFIVELVDMSDDKLDVNDYDDFCDKNKKKVYKKGFAQFVGELYKNDFVDCQYILEYLDGLIGNIRYNLENDNTNIENSSICLVQLVNTTMSNNEFLESSCCDDVKKIMEMKNLPKKIKFKFMDLIDGR